MLSGSDRSFRRLLLLIAVVPVVLVALPLARDRFVNDAYTPGMVNAFSAYLIVGAAFFALAVFGAWRLNRRGRRFDAMLLASVLATVGGSITASGYEVLSPSTSSKQLVQDFLATDPEYSKADPFYSVGLFEQTLQPYLGRTTILVDYLDELGLGAAAEPTKVRFNFADFADEWQSLERGYAITDFDQLPRFDLHGLEYHVVAADLRRVILARHSVP